MSRSGWPSRPRRQPRPATPPSPPLAAEPAAECPLTELPVYACAHCRGQDERPVRRRREPAHPYTANHVSQCGVCGLDIEIGDPIARDSGEGPWVHEGCA